MLRSILFLPIWMFDLDTITALQNSSSYFLPKARLRVLALQSLLEVTRLPYAKLHPYRGQVSKGLLAPLDDRKRIVRQTAVKVRNEWMVMDR